MSSSTTSPPLDRCSGPATAAGEACSSLVRGDRRSKSPSPPSDQLARFDHIEAYEGIVEARREVRRLYSDKNIEHADAHEVELDAKERLKQSREKPKRYRQVRVGGGIYEHAGEVESWLKESLDTGKGEREEEIGDAQIYDEQDEEDGLQGSFWGWDDSNEHPEDRGQIPGQGGPIDEEVKETLELHVDQGRHGEYRGGAATEGQPWVSRDDDQNDDQKSVQSKKSGEEEGWEWETISNVSIPNSLFHEEVIDAKEAFSDAKRNASATWEEMRALKTQEIRYNKMLEQLQKQYPKLRGYVGPQASKKRTRSEEDFDSNLPSTKRLCPVPNTNDIEKLVAYWHRKVTTQLKNHASLESFPTPVDWACLAHDECWVTKPNSGNASVRLLYACEHNIADACDRLGKKQLQKYIRAFHPDRFSACKEEKREEWKSMANEVFVVLSGLFEEKFGKAHVI